MQNRTSLGNTGFHFMDCFSWSSRNVLPLILMSLLALHVRVISERRALYPCCWSLLTLHWCWINSYSAKYFTPTFQFVFFFWEVSSVLFFCSLWLELPLEKCDILLILSQPFQCNIQVSLRMVMFFRWPCSNETITLFEGLLWGTGRVEDMGTSTLSWCMWYVCTHSFRPEDFFPGRDNKYM